MARSLQYPTDEEQTEISRDIFMFYSMMEERISAVMVRKLREWQEQHPKRSVTFIDAMGMVQVGVSGGANAEPYQVLDFHPDVDSDARHYRIFAEIFDAVNWYNDVTEQCGRITISDIVIGDPIFPCHYDQQRSYMSVLDGA